DRVLVVVAGEREVVGTAGGVVERHGGAVERQIETQRTAGPDGATVHTERVVGGVIGDPDLHAGSLGVRRGERHVGGVGCDRDSALFAGLKVDVVDVQVEARADHPDRGQIRFVESGAVDGDGVFDAVGHGVIRFRIFHPVFV